MINKFNHGYDYTDSTGRDEVLLPIYIIVSNKILGRYLDKIKRSLIDNLLSLLDRTIRRQKPFLKKTAWRENNNNKKGMFTSWNPGTQNKN